MLLAASAVGCRSFWDRPDVQSVFGPKGKDPKNLLKDAEKNSEKEPPVGLVEFENTKELFDHGKFLEAQKACEKHLKKFKDKKIEEDFLFLIAECQFERGRYPAAQDSYDLLFKKYPSTRFKDPAVRHMFAIANAWLKSPKPASEVELTQFRDGTLGKADPQNPSPYQFPLKPNLFDKSRPLFDTQGRAMQELRSIWMHDPAGPLADDALMTSAVYSLRVGDYQEADRLFDEMRKSYSKSPHVELAYVLGSHAKLMTYQGARYDGRKLEEARQLMKSTVTLFPDSPQRPKILADLRKLRLMAAEREWAKVELYQRKHEPASAVVYCNVILESYPRTPYADMAREYLKKNSLLEPGTAPVDPPKTYDEDPVPAESEGPPGRVHISDKEPPPPRR